MSGWPGETPIVGYRKMWLRIAKQGGLPADVTPQVLAIASPVLPPILATTSRQSPACGHKTHSITSRYVHSADAVLLAAADAVANATMKLMASDEAQPQLRDQRRDGSVAWDEFTGP